MNLPTLKNGNQPADVTARHAEPFGELVHGQQLGQYGTNEHALLLGSGSYL